ncbi:HIT family protein [Actinoplanes sp. NPDC049265]|uniref:HIT family protein n=1 Tax=Actinoplanes sp. NPDC049265 TaxID=3363902 RepID=UPI00371CE0E7
MFDLDAYEERVLTGPCFVCAFLDGHPGYRHHVVYEDDTTIAFLNRWPTLRGYTLVCPKRHVEDWVSLPPTEFLTFQSVVQRVASAIARVVPAERMYSLSLGSRQGNAHLHWHLAPLPPGVPYDQQQYHALMAENGVLRVDDAGQSALAARIREAAGG